MKPPPPLLALRRIGWVATCWSFGLAGCGGDEASSGAKAGTEGPGETGGTQGGAMDGTHTAGSNDTAGSVMEAAAGFMSGDVDGAPRADAANEGSDGGSSCPGVFCEDFEDGQIDSVKWDVETMGGATMVVQQKNVAHGKYAAQFHGLGVPSGGATSAYVYLITKAAPAVLQAHNFGRAYFFIAPKESSINLGMVFGGTTGFPRPTYMSIAGHSGGWQFGFIKLQGSPRGESQAYASSPMPLMTWTCLEWE